MKKTFSKIVKDEIITYSWTDEQTETIIGVLLLLANSNIIKFKQVTLGKKIYSYFKTKNINIKVTKVRKHYEIEIPKQFKINKNLLSPNNSEEIDRAILAGFFIAKGSVNSPETKYYHLEIRTKDLETTSKLIEILRKYSFEPKKYETDKRLSIYFKKTTYVSDFLKIINAHEGVLYFEEMWISRDFSNAFTRLATIDIINLKKTVIASQKQIKMINILLDGNALRQHSLKYTQIAKIRLENPETNVSDLTRMYNKKYDTSYSKSAINHWLRFLIELGEKNK